MRGSKYELKFDYQGKPINEEGIRQVLRRGTVENDQQVTGLSSSLGKQKQANKPGMFGGADKEAKEGGQPSHQASKEMLSQSHSHQNVKKTATEKDEVDGKIKSSKDFEGDEKMNGAGGELF